MGAKVLLINKNDNIVIAVEEINAGELIKVKNKKIKVISDIPVGHKIALQDFNKGEKVIRYGFPIGVAAEEIKQGEWVHTHNLKTSLSGKLDYNYQPKFSEVEKSAEMPTFMGYKRENGKVGIRNDIWIINTVGCINKVVEKMALKAEMKYSDLIENEVIDSIHAFPHPYGCSQLGDDLEMTQKALAGLVNHPNAAAVMVVGLGCENNLIEDFKKYIGDYNSDRVKFINLQDVEDDQKAADNILDNLVDYAEKFKQQEIPVSELKIGLKCGGSDGFSGVTANPLLGRISDKLGSYGGISILTEVPEMFGAETILMNRAKDEKTFKKVVKLINGFKDYFLSHDQEIYENPSPGNKEGGITTLEEKSLGCTQKGGTGIVNDVFFYGEQVTGKGLNLLESPGNDLVATTALAIAGAHMVLFTTGRGTPFGGPVPTVKVSTNTRLYNKKRNWIDFNAGELLEGRDMEFLSEEFFEYLLGLASKKAKTKNEINDYREIAIFKDGVTL
ncbi:D-altronate dehydratase [Halanaerobium congolense]|uniref:D-altronate dehydratase n=1 Tax=Halanaerobium congolense TaxID=54121 RepID=A0A1G8MPT7_9FIRM|nr:altronate dehydratase family protein [Halanaerobium congolense]SDI69877.1 D-altronate dehydratase [Halanaerobium congolense]SET36867.1 D-altronate dehydratase [Halanaerobium congolense]